MLSERNTTSDKFSVGNLALVLGPQHSGKSYLMKKALLSLENKTQAGRRVLVHVDLSSYGFLNFDSFRNRLETACIDQISAQLQASVGMIAILKTLEASIEEKYLGWLSLRFLQRLVNDESRIRLTLEWREKLAELAEDAKIEDLVSSIQQSLQIGEVGAWLELIRDICIDMETLDSQAENLAITGTKV